MQVVILAAGEGTRMRPLTERRPKPMLTVAGRPLVDHVAQTAVSAGADELIVVVGYEGQQIRDHFGERLNGVPIRYAEQTTQAGTADAVAAASEYLDGPFAVLNGDNRYNPNTLLRLFENCPAIACTHVDTPSNYGVVETDHGQVVGLHEKPDDPDSNLVNAGGYCFPASAREHLEVSMSERGERELTDVFNRVIEDTDVSPIQLDDWLDVGRPWELLEANERAIEQRSRNVQGDVHEDATLNGAVVVEPGATVGPGALIEGPAVIQTGASVGPSAYIRGPTLLEPDVSVGQGSEIENSVVMAGTTIDRLVYVGDSIVGRACHLGGRTTLVNELQDGAPIRCTVKGTMTSTGRTSFGAVLGDEVKTAVGTTIDPGVMLDGGTTTTPAENVTADTGAKMSREH